MSDATSVLFGLEDEFRVLEVQRVDVSSVQVLIEQTAREGSCPVCGVLSGVVKDRPVMRLKDLPMSGQTVELWWRKPPGLRRGVVSAQDFHSGLGSGPAAGAGHRAAAAAHVCTIRAMIWEARRAILEHLYRQRLPVTDGELENKSWLCAAHLTKINSSDPALTAVCTAYATHPFPAFLDPPVELPSFRPRGCLHLDRRIHLPAICFGTPLHLVVAEIHV